MNTATQTSPSLSHSSTNLTWASDCSSSPSLTSASDLDAGDEGNQSSSSADCVDQESRAWIHRHQWQQELGTKSSSAPVLKKATKVSRIGHVHAALNFIVLYTRIIMDEFVYSR